MLGCPSDRGLDFCGVTRPDHCQRDSRRRVPRPVEAVVLAGDWIGSYPVTECFNELLQRSLHGPNLASDLGGFEPGKLQLILVGSYELDLALQFGQPLVIAGSGRHLFMQ